MLISVLQTLAEILAGGTSLTSTEQIDFNRPGSRREEAAGRFLNLYLYDIRESKQVQHSGRQVDRRNADRQPQTARVGWAPDWFDLSLLITAWDRTALGEYHLLNEALGVLLRHRALQEDFLAPELRGYGNLALSLSVAPPIELGALWGALSLPLRPAVFLTVTAPITQESNQTYRVWERIISLTDNPPQNASNHVLVQRATIGGVIKHVVTEEPLAEVAVRLLDTEKQTTSNQNGLFFFDNLRNGNFILNLQHPSFVSQNCNVLVDGSSRTFKEVLLTPR
ncbi:DUF4255 domain-containing protein [Phormidium tenue FACHB-886]|nr:DUF4255 domain-containing protein [Phormidium tenue FACHB-886]